MKIQALFYLSCFLFISITSFSQRKETKGLKLEMIIPNDSLDLNDSMIIVARLTNKSKSTILIQSDFCLRSNLYPNGIGGAIATNATFNFQLGTKSDFNSWHYENLLYIDSKSFVELKPGNTHSFNIDLGSHIKSYNLESNNEKKIVKGKTYMLKLEYYSYSEHNSKLFRGKAISKSRKITLD
jgi:hypothetical protein